MKNILVLGMFILITSICFLQTTLAFETEEVPELPQIPEPGPISEPIRISDPDPIPNPFPEESISEKNKTIN